MGDLAEMEQRIRAALERLDAGIDRLAPILPADPAEHAGLQAEIARLQQALQDERNAAQAQAVARDRLLRQVDAQSLDNQRLRGAVALLREEVRRLSEALAEGLADPALIHHALLAEVEGLRAQRASETVEIADILVELDRIVAGAGAPDPDLAASEEPAHA